MTTRTFVVSGDSEKRAAVEDALVKAGADSVVVTPRTIRAGGRQSTVHQAENEETWEFLVVCGRDAVEYLRGDGFSVAAI